MANPPLHIIKNTAGGDNDCLQPPWISRAGSISTTPCKRWDTEVQIIHRLDVSLTEEENRYTNPVFFYDNTSKLLTQNLLRKTNWYMLNEIPKWEKDLCGRTNHEPLIFQRKQDTTYHAFAFDCKSILFPDVVEKEKRFNLIRWLWFPSPLHVNDAAGNQNSRKWYNWSMGYLSSSCITDQKRNCWAGYPDFNKVGDAYGFLTDGLYRWL